MPVSTHIVSLKEFTTIYMPDRIIYVDGLLGRTKIKNPVNVPGF
jgi:hypothetical protein